jgi:hypothetical protein
MPEEWYRTTVNTQRTHIEMEMHMRECPSFLAAFFFYLFLVLDLLIRLGCAVFGHQISQIHLYAHAYFSARA